MPRNFSELKSGGGGQWGGQFHIYIKRWGERIPPCLTPLETVKKLENPRHHLMVNFWVPYQWYRMRPIKAGQPRSINLPNSLLWLTLSKALEASNIVTYIEDPLAI